MIKLSEIKITDGLRLGQDKNYIPFLYLEASSIAFLIKTGTVLHVVPHKNDTQHVIMNKNA